MANNIAYIEAYLGMLDAIYAKESATALLEVNPLAVRFSNENAKTLSLQSLAIEGLGNYSRSAGYVAGKH